MTTRTEYRAASVGNIRADDADPDLFVFPLSSEEPYGRYMGDEILVHSDDAVDLSWLNSGNAPLLDNHNRYDGLSAQIGVVVKAWLENARIYAAVKFSGRQEVAGIISDIKSGIIRNVSVGYQVDEYVVSEDKKSYRVTKWKPVEASFVTIPADQTVGVGRKGETQLKQEGQTMPPEVENLEDRGAAPAPAPAPTPVLPTVPVQTPEARGGEIVAAMSEINALATAHNQRQLADEYIAECMRSGRVPSYAVFQGKLRAVVPAETPLVDRSIGLNQAERQRFSVVRLARAMADGATRQDLELAAFEIEACGAASQRAERAIGQYMLPVDVMNSWGDYIDSEGNRSSMLGYNSRAAMGTAGNPNVQDTDHLADRFIDNLRAASAVLSMGVTTLTGLNGNIEIPGGDTNATAAWLAAEDADAAETVPTFRKVTMSIKDVAAYTDLTRRMIMQSTIDVEAYVRRQIDRAMAEAIDLAGLQGSGLTGIPRGLKNTAGIGSVAFVGANPTWGEIVDLESDVAAANALLGRTGYLSNTNMNGYFKQTSKVSGQNGFIVEGNGGTLNGHTYRQSNLVTAGDLFFGNWADMLMGLWGGMALDRDTAAKFLAGGVRLRAIQSVDFAVARVGSFSLGN